MSISAPQCGRHWWCVLFQTQKVDKAVQLVNYAKCLYLPTSIVASPVTNPGVGEFRSPWNSGSPFRANGVVPSIKPVLRTQAS